MFELEKWLGFEANNVEREIIKRLRFINLSNTLNFNGLFNNRNQPLEVNFQCGVTNTDGLINVAVVDKAHKLASKNDEIRGEF